MTAPSTSGALSKIASQLRHFSTDFRPCARHRDRASCYLRGFLRALVRGFLSILLLIMGMEAYQRLHEMKRVAHWFALYAFVAPIAHGLIAFGLGYLAHIWTGFSPGGVVLLSVIAASNSDISGPPTLRAAIRRKPVSLHWLQYRSVW